MFFLLEKRDGTPIVVAGPCWPFCTFVTVPLIIVLSGLVVYFILLDPKIGLVSMINGCNLVLPNIQLTRDSHPNTQPQWSTIAYICIVLIVLSVLFFVSCRDPGLLERVTDEEVANNGWFWNEQVGSYRPAGAMYCRECQVSNIKQIRDLNRSQMTFSYHSVILFPTRHSSMTLITSVPGLALQLEKET
jgi:hypothetical protein